MTGPLISHLVAACVAAAIYGGWVEARLEAQISTIKTRHATEKRVAAEDATQRLQAAQARGDQLINGLEQRQDQINQLAREKRDAINKVTTGRTCLGEPALRMLHSAPGLSVRGLTPAISGTVATGSATAPDTFVSTDIDIASWAVDAGAQYEVCRARLDALIDWHLAPQTTTNAAQGKAP